MNENTPNHKLKQNFKENNDLKLNSISTPIEVNKYYDKLLIHRFKDNQNRKYKTIAQSRQNNNNNNNNNNIITNNNDDSIPKPQNLFMNHYDALNKTTTDSHNHKNEIIDYKKKTNSIPKNRNNEKMENNLFSKSTNNLSKINTNNDKIINNNNNNFDENFGDDEDSENLSKLAEDLLSISDEYNIQMMRRGPIDKNDFIGESKVIFNINNQIEQNLTRINMNVINLENINQKINPVPKLQSQIYISPLQKLNLKNINYMNKLFNLGNKSNNNNINNEINNNLNSNLNNNLNNNMKNNINKNIYSNINNNINNQKNNHKNEVNNYNLNNSRGGDLRKYSKIKTHISSNSIVNNNTSAQINNNQILNHINDQINKSNKNNNNNILKKTTNSVFNNSNVYDSRGGINQNLNNSNYNPDRFIENNNFNYTSNEHIYNYNNPNSNRNNNNSHSIGKQINSIINRDFNPFKKNNISYSGYNHKTNVNYNQIINSSKIDNNISNTNTNVDNINYINNNLYNTNQIKNTNNTNNYNNISKANYNNNVNNIKNINKQVFKRLNEDKSFSKKNQMNNPQQNRIIDNNRYGMNNIDSINKNINNMNYSINNDYILHDKTNKGIPNNNTNKSVSKNERSHRKNIINIPQQNFLRTSDIQNYVDNNIFQGFNDPDSKISFNTAIQKVIQRNSLQSKSHNKNQYNDIKSSINKINNNTGNKGMNYINVNNIQNIPNNHMDNGDDNILLKTFQQQNIFSLKNSNLSNNQIEYLNKNIHTYQGNNDESNYLNNNNYMSKSPFEVPTF